MSAILRKSYSVFNAASFINTFGNTTPAATGQALYLAVGRRNEWSPDDAIPETASSSLTKADEFRKQLIFLKKIAPQDIALVLPRRDFAWTHVTAPVEDPSLQFELAAINPDDTTPYAARNYYFRTSTNHIWMVTKTPSDLPYATPDLMAEPGVPTGDGSITNYGGITDFNLQYMCSADALVGTKFADDNWIPIGYNIDGGWTNGQPSGTISDDQGNYGDVNANGVLSVNHLMINITLDSTFLEVIDAVPAEFRQVGIVVGPKDGQDPAVALTGDAYGYTTNTSEKDIGDYIADINIDGVPTTTFGNIIAGDGAGAAIPVDGFDVDNSTGELIYLENRLVIVRTAGQSETTKVIIEF